MGQYKGKVSIAGKEYTCEVINGVRYIDGVTVYEFAKRLSKMEFIELSTDVKKYIEDNMDVLKEEIKRNSRNY